MKKRFSIGFGILILGLAGGFLAFDSGMNSDVTAKREAATAFKPCGLCDAHKADLENIRRYKEEREAWEKLGDAYAQ
jgi:hypothetical protein